MGGWQASSIISLLSGQPLNIRYPDAAGIVSDNQPESFLGTASLRPNLIDGSLGVLAPEGQRSYLNFFNRANLATPPVTAPFGNLGRNVAYGYGLYQVDFVMAKSFPMRFINEGARVQFRGEFYNFFNRTNFQAPQVNIAAQISDESPPPRTLVPSSWLSSLSFETKPEKPNPTGRSRKERRFLL